MTKKKKKKTYLTDVQKGWATIGIGIFALLALTVYTAPTKADGGLSGLSGNFLTGHFEVGESSVVNILKGFLGVPEGEEVKLGAAAGPILDSEQNQTGVLRVGKGSALVNSTSSVLWWSGTVTATTTLDTFACRIKNLGLGTQNVYFSTSTGNYSTSTPALGYLSATAGQHSWSLLKNGATTTGAAVDSETSTGDVAILPGLGVTGNSNYFLKPGEGITVRIATSSAGTFSSYATGYCNFTGVKF